MLRLETFADEERLNTLLDLVFSIFKQNLGLGSGKGFFEIILG